MENKDASSCFCKNLTDLIKAQHYTNHRGIYTHNFTDTKYAYIGADPNRANIRVTSPLYHKNSVPPGCWSKTCQTMKHFKKLMCAYAPTGELCCISVAKKLLNFPTMVVNDATSHANG